MTELVKTYKTREELKSEGFGSFVQTKLLRGNREKEFKKVMRNVQVNVHEPVIYYTENGSLLTFYTDNPKSCDALSEAALYDTQCEDLPLFTEEA